MANGSSLIKNNWLFSCNERNIISPVVASLYFMRLDRQPSTRPLARHRLHMSVHASKTSHLGIVITHSITWTRWNLLNYVGCCGKCGNCWYHLIGNWSRLWIYQILFLVGLKNFDTILLWHDIIKDFKNQIELSDMSHHTTTSLLMVLNVRRVVSMWGMSPV